jgi:hypothetical protein
LRLHQRGAIRPALAAAARGKRVPPALGGRKTTNRANPVPGRRGRNVARQLFDSVRPATPSTAGNRAEAPVHRRNDLN